jgi:hypothetical protein
MKRLKRWTRGWRTRAVLRLANGRALIVNTHINFTTREIRNLRTDDRFLVEFGEDPVENWSLTDLRFVADTKKFLTSNQP